MYHYEIMHLPGKYNQVADRLSWLPLTNENCEEVDDNECDVAFRYDDVVFIEDHEMEVEFSEDKWIKEMQRETPEHIRDAEYIKGEPRGQPGEGEVGETEDVGKEAKEVVPRTETEERSVEFLEEGAEGGATEKNRPEQEHPEASHGPEGRGLQRERVLQLQGHVLSRVNIRRTMPKPVAGQYVHVRNPGFVEKEAAHWSSLIEIVKVLDAAVKLEDGKIRNLQHVSLCEGVNKVENDNEIEGYLCPLMS
ncbi:hypothetical protein NDU88_002742 [Pleurodeles waltl]|uniref:Uncharacterized protein n=1 Tax=Pleurodeles waltl TaxID=8319 RepID=A0AAV7NGA4_PLEWA|nr:hypothetical protein NDU88_002742 [Pleurodeles waltl]